MSVIDLQAVQAAGLTEGGAFQTSGTAKSTGNFQSVLGNVMNQSAVNLDAIFEEAAAAYDISPKLLRAVAKTESNFNPRATSKAGAMGVMQLMPGTARSLGVSDPYDPRQNIMGGAKYLKQNLDKFQDVSLALAAYNAGPGSVLKYDGIPPYKETQNYVRKVMADYTGSDTLYSGKTVMTAQASSGTGSSALYSGSGAEWLQAMKLTGAGNANSFMGFFGTNNSLASLYAMSKDEKADISGEDWANMLQIVRLQMMMNSERDSNTLI